MMQPLVDILFRFARQTFLFADTCRGKWVAMDTVYLIKRQPVAHQIFVAVKTDITETHEGIHHIAVYPAVVFFAQRQRHFVVRKRDQRFNIMAAKFAEHLLVKLQTCLVWRSIFAGRENT